MGAARDCTYGLEDLFTVRACKTKKRKERSRFRTIFQDQPRHRCLYPFSGELNSQSLQRAIFEFHLQDTT